MALTRLCEIPIVAFEAFTTKSTGGGHHQRRAIAYAAAACVLVGLGLASAALKSKDAPVLPPKEPEPVEVQLRPEEEKIEEEKPPEPTPEPPAVEVPKHVKVSAAPPPPPPPDPDPNLKAKLDEKDPSKDVGAAGSHGGDPTGKPGSAIAKPEAPLCGGEGQICCVGSCHGGLTCEASVCRKPAPPPPVATVKKPAMVSEDDLPAKALSTPPPSYPAAARAAGITGKVVVRLTIDELGNVREAKIAKGDPNFDDVVLTAVKSWKYEPAKHQDGKPFLSIKTVAIPFKIKM